MLFPSFSTLKPEEIEPNISKFIQQNKTKFDEIVSEKKPHTWSTLIAPMEEADDKLAKYWSPISHLHSVKESEPLREAYKKCLPILTDYHTYVMQHEGFYNALKTIAESPEFSLLTPAQRKIIENDLRDFRLSGVHLPPAQKKRFAECQKELSRLTTLFSEHLLDATHAWSYHITDKAKLAGLPEETIKMLEENARDKNKEGWVLTLDYPCYSMMMKYADDRELRRMMYEAYVTRASDQGPHAGQWDNSEVMEAILKIRHEMAELLGFKNYAEYSLATKMADTPKRVMSFLEDLVDKSKSTALEEVQELKIFAKKIDELDALESWDLAYYSEKLQEEKYAISEEALRPYFPITKVLPGMFAVMQKIYGIQIKEYPNVDVWHPHVQCYAVHDEKNELRGYFYIDLYARPHKKDGAWMDDCQVRRLNAENNIQLPVAFLTCNFTRPIGDKPALLTHDDVITLFHEFGHCLHHLMTKVDYAGVSGINGVAWDAVEFPSQFLEFWCWEREPLNLISGHYETNDPIPDELYQKMLAAKNFQSGLQMLRQLEFALFDFRLHLEFDPTKSAQVQTKLDEVRQHVSVLKPPAFNRFQHSFSHIFAGGYAAGYYGYKWAEVLSSDAFQKFEEKGIFDHDTGQSFLKNILEKGGVEEPMKLFVAFRGREPTIDALLKYSGLK